MFRPIASLTLRRHQLENSFIILAKTFGIIITRRLRKGSDSFEYFEDILILEDLL